MQVTFSGDFSGRQYTIDAQDFWTAFGWMIESGSDDLLQLYKSKEVYSKDWKGQNGKQYDLSKRFFEDKVATLSGYLIADDEEDFWNKYLRLWDVLKSPGARTLFSFELKQSFSVFYLDSPNLKRFTKLDTYPNKIAMKLDVQFQVMFMEFESPTAGPSPPRVDAGGDKSIRLPTSSLAIINASVVPRSGSTITSTLWEVISYAVLPTITNKTTLTPTIAGLTIAGSYVFRLKATDSNGLEASNEMTVTVFPEIIGNTYVASGYMQNGYVK